jgi:hypothetical protein
VVRAVPHCILARPVGESRERGTAARKPTSRSRSREDEHLCHTTGRCRELWIQSLGLAAVIAPEEEKEVKTAIGAAREKQARKDRL